MKIKHWQGYGCVNARVLDKNEHCVEIEVTGAHEYGVATTDRHFVRDWLLAKVAKDWAQIPSFMLDLFVYEEAWNKAIYTIRPRHGLTLKEALAYR